MSQNPFLTSFLGLMQTSVGCRPPIVSGSAMEYIKITWTLNKIFPSGHISFTFMRYKNQSEKA